ncbi:MAG: transposase [Saprospiraceae bacterium]|nr:transposase [Saprospiraceae bacterium]
MINISHSSTKTTQMKFSQRDESLTHQEFLRRFEQHILPKRFVKIRHAVILTIWE